VGAGVVAGIGFTVSLFIADLSFTGVRLAETKVAILGASVAAGVIGAVVLRTLSRGSGTPRPEGVAS
jgi:Na+:H+ antiporter, NhaA family